jgi:Lrp/AsnC family transcriptional regulator, leucine-responsive regulatory protein
MKIQLDELDFLILRRLKNNALEPLSETQKALDVPRSTIHVRIKKLQERGIIKKYTIDLNKTLLGYQITAFVMISFDQYATELTQEDVARQIAKFSNVEEVYIISGEWDIIIKISTKDINELGNFSVNVLKTIPGLGKTITFISLMSIKSHLDPPYLIE